MFSSTDKGVSLSNLVRRLGRGTLFQPIVLGLAVLVFVTGVDTSVPQTASQEQFHLPRQHQLVVTPTRPSSIEIKSRFNQRRLTEAAMTGHRLTEAHFFSHRTVVGKLPAEIRNIAQKG